MTKDEWKDCREHLEFKEGDWVIVTWHWNFGTTKAKRLKQAQGYLRFIGDRGIDLDKKRISYKVLEGIDDPADAYADGFVWLRDGDGSLYSTIL